MRYWDTLLREERNGLEIVVDKTWEDLPLDHLFDTSEDPETGLPYYDVKDMQNKINSGDLDYFMLRARVFVEGLEVGSHIVGGFLYEDAREVLTDGMAEDLIYQAIEEAKPKFYQLARKFGGLSEMVDKQAI